MQNSELYIPQKKLIQLDFYINNFKHFIKAKLHMARTKKQKHLSCKAMVLCPTPYLQSVLQCNFLIFIAFFLTSVSPNSIFILPILGFLVLDIIYCLPMLIDENVNSIKLLNTSCQSHLSFRSLLVTYATLDKILIPLVTSGKILFPLIIDNLF